MSKYEKCAKIKAGGNIEKWGLQDRQLLERAMMEELGELTQASLQYDWEDGSMESIREELTDLWALMYQYEQVIKKEDD